MKRLIWLPLAGFLLIAGATIAAAAPALVDSAKGLIVAADPGASPGPVTIGSDLDHPGQDLLNQVLADLVSQNVITQAQSDAITGELQTRIDAQRADMEAQREQMRQTMEQVQGFLEDGTITQDEINQLPADSALRTAFDSIAQDGKITVEQLRDLGPGFGFMGGGHDGRGMPGRGPGGHGPGPWFMGPDDGSDPNSSPAPSVAPSSTNS